MVTNDGNELKVTDADGDILYINTSERGAFYFEIASEHLELVVLVDQDAAKEIVSFLQGWLKN